MKIFEYFAVLKKILLFLYIDCCTKVQSSFPKLILEIR